MTNRLLLREIMRAAGFRNYVNEWWHYTLIDEPYPDTYFDLPIE
jgi:D-alanyl-D-alanine dipeptidase